MKLTLKRVAFQENYTIGKLYINDVYFCDTLEDCVRSGAKIFGKTAINEGSYIIKLTYSNHFGKIMPELLNVKGFSGIRIHSGNDENDTQGCILVGKNLVRGKVLLSRMYYNMLYKILLNSYSSNDLITIDIVNILTKIQAVNMA